MKEVTKSFDINHLDRKNVTDFVEIAESELLAEYQSVKDKGDFTLIEQFAHNVKGAAERCSLPHLVEYAEELQQFVVSFDIIEVDILMKQFPDIINNLKE